MLEVWKTTTKWSTYVVRCGSIFCDVEGRDLARLRICSARDWPGAWWEVSLFAIIWGKDCYNKSLPRIDTQVFRKEWCTARCNLASAWMYDANGHRSNMVVAYSGLHIWNGHDDQLGSGWDTDTGRKNSIASHAVASWMSCIMLHPYAYSKSHLAARSKTVDDRNKMEEVARATSATCPSSSLVSRC